MTREDIICMAREAGLASWMRLNFEAPQEDLERFAQLVAAAEREACAKVCEDISFRASDRHDAMADDRNDEPILYMSGKEQGAGSCAIAIRARGQQ